MPRSRRLAPAPRRRAPRRRYRHFALTRGIHPLRAGAQSTIELTRAEALQLSACKPSTSVELHALLERCDERLTAEEVEQLLQICAEML